MIRWELDREDISEFVEKLEEGTTNAQCRVCPVHAIARKLRCSGLD